MDYKIEHVAGIDNAAPDALSRRSDFALKRMSLKGPELLTIITTAARSDRFFGQIIEKLRDENANVPQEVERAYRNFEEVNQVLCWIGAGDRRLYVRMKRVCEQTWCLVSTM